jgi:CheY-like chemotaxis protein
MAAPARAATRAAHRTPAPRAFAAGALESTPQAAPPARHDEAFLAELAHDLRTPLNAMVGWLHLLASETISDELRQRALAGLQRAVEQQRRVVATLDSPADFIQGPRSGGSGAVAPASRVARIAPVETDGLRSRSSAGAADRTNNADPALDDASPEVGALQGVFILAIDDDPDVLQMLQSLLEHSGAIVESTTSPDKALQRYASWASGEGERLVLSDLAMQERDGISLMQAVRALEREANLRRVPAIALSAHFRPDTRREAFEGGFDLFLAKPIDPSVLLNHLRAMLDR